MTRLRSSDISNFRTKQRILKRGLEEDGLVEVQRGDFFPLPPLFNLSIAWATVEPGPELWVLGRAGGELVLPGGLFAARLTSCGVAMDCTSTRLCHWHGTGHQPAQGTVRAQPQTMGCGWDIVF